MMTDLKKFNLLAERRRLRMNERWKERMDVEHEKEEDDDDDDDGRKLCFSNASDDLLKVEVMKQKQHLLWKSMAGDEASRKRCDYIAYRPKDNVTNMLFTDTTIHNHGNYNDTNDLNSRNSINANINCHNINSHNNGRAINYTRGSRHNESDRQAEMTRGAYAFNASKALNDESKENHNKKVTEIDTCCKNINNDNDNTLDSNSAYNNNKANKNANNVIVNKSARNVGDDDYADSEDDDLKFNKYNFNKNNAVDNNNNNNNNNNGANENNNNNNSNNSNNNNNGNNNNNNINNKNSSIGSFGMNEGLMDGVVCKVCGDSSVSSFFGSVVCVPCKVMVVVVGVFGAVVVFGVVVVLRVVAFVATLG